MRLLRLASIAVLLTASLGLTACGGGDDGKDDAQQASESLQRKGVPAKQADELASTAEQLRKNGFSKADAAKLKAGTAATQQRVVGLQRQIVSITKDVQSGKISDQDGTRRIQRLAQRIQQEALNAAEQLDKAGALPPSARKQVEAAKARLQKQAASEGQ